MPQPAARMGDPTAHGGVMTTGFPQVLIGGLPAARLGDMATCVGPRTLSLLAILPFSLAAEYMKERKT